MLKKLNIIFSSVTALLLSVLIAVFASAASKGDIDADGSITVSDARQALRYAVKLDAPNAEQTFSSDVDGDGQLTVADARIILRVAVKLQTLETPHVHQYKTAQYDSSTPKGKHNLVCACGDKITVDCTLGAKEERAGYCSKTPAYAQKCTVCGRTQLTVGEKCTPNKKSPTCTANTVCTKCGNIVAKALGHSYNIPEPTCTVAKQCIRCGSNAPDSKPALGHDFSVPATAVIKGITASPTCARCGNENPDKLALFNNFTNSIKCSANSEWKIDKRVTQLVKSTMTTECPDNTVDFGPYTPAVKKLIKDPDNGLTGTSVAYKASYDKSIELYLPYSTENVSSLTQADVSGVSVTLQKGFSGAEVLSGFDNKFTVGSKEYDISAFKDFSYTGDVIKMTVTVKNESFTVDGASGADDAKKLYDKDNSYKSSMSKITRTIDVITDAEAYGPENNYTLTQNESFESGDLMTMTMHLRQIKSSGTVTYWFKANTYEPIMASYNLKETLDQEVKMTILELVDGKMYPFVTNTFNEVYIFTDAPSGN